GISRASDPSPLRTVEIGGAIVADCYTTSAAEYVAARERLGVIRRHDRVAVRVSGKDRKAWLHNLLSNEIKKLESGGGCYAFAIDLRGRVLFDVTVLDVGDAIWLLTDAGSRQTLLTHLERYHMSEDVALHDEQQNWECLALIGPLAESIVTTLMTANAVSNQSAESGGIGSANYAHAAFSFATTAGDDPSPSVAVRVVRDSLGGGLPVFELWLPASASDWLWRTLTHDYAALPVGFAALDALRIEAGVPWMHRDIDERVVAPETGQTERAISYRKGCYLGQEVIERMRSHGSLARRLVRIAVADAAMPPILLPAAIKFAGAEVGRITSLVAHPMGTQSIGLGYLKTAIREAGDLSVGEPARTVTFAEITPH
ncbi:MAG: folate-binding protein YgfZ, partial [Phycisphaerales bacterium]|nr:folate-binding protein YgfZ [Phycisphaerales bacterium]